MIEDFFVSMYMYISPSFFLGFFFSFSNSNSNIGKKKREEAKKPLSPFMRFHESTFYL